MGKIIVFLEERFETVEALAVADILRRAKIQVDTVSINDNIEVMSAQNIYVKADFLFKEYNFSDVDLLYLPGGPGTKNYKLNEELLQLLVDFSQKGKRIAALCAAPSILGELGLLKGKKATCFPGFEDKLTGAEIVAEKVITDGLITTGIGMGVSIEFGLELVKLLTDENTANEVGKSIQFYDD